jgi:hypothetical protein
MQKNVPKLSTSGSLCVSADKDKGQREDAGIRFTITVHVCEWNGQQPHAWTINIKSVNSLKRKYKSNPRSYSWT